MKILININSINSVVNSAIAVKYFSETNNQQMTKIKTAVGKSELLCETDIR